MIRFYLFIALFGFLLNTSLSHADEFRPAVLKITETESGWYELLWKVPLQNGLPLGISPKLPKHLVQLGPATIRENQDTYITQSLWRAEAGSLVGSHIEINGLTALSIDVIVQVELKDGSEHSAILRSASPSFIIHDHAKKWAVAASYWKIGAIHILDGFDHLLFVLALMLIISNVWVLLKTITAFTLAHSISLALATLGIVDVPGPPTEAVIALSILFLAVEIVHNQNGRITLTKQKPWLVALSFGLIHGLGFAGALAEVGLPEQSIPLALLMFNVGVETGQLLFICVVLIMITLLKQLKLPMTYLNRSIIPYVIGSTAAFWTLQRLLSF